MSAPYLPAFGGAPLVGDRLVRLVYMDEAGISQHEPITVVCGVIVHGDNQLNLVRNHLRGRLENRLAGVLRRGGL